ncbi:MAG: hypothetical protein F4X12_12985 [Acidobacteriia bacterium]|nr:hypothetical protein [Terriglobia bacterium]
MVRRGDLKNWTVLALGSLGGAAHHIVVAKRIWEEHEDEIRASGDLLYTWQYELRWAVYSLRKDGRVAPATAGPRGVWQLNPRDP